MESGTTSINYSAASSYVNEFGSLSSKIQNLPKASENAGFQILEELGLSGGFPASFDNGMAQIGNYITTVTTGCNSYLEKVKGNDSNLYNNFLPPTTSDFEVTLTSDSNDGKKPGGGGGGGPQDDAPIFLENQINEIEAEDLVKIDNTGKIEQYLSSISMNELDVLVQLLKNLAKENNVKVDELFDENYSLLLKEKVLNEVNMSSEFKAIIDEGSSISLVNSLQSLVDGKLNTFKVDDVTADTLIHSVKLYAEDHNTTVEELMKANSQNSELLPGAMTEFAKLESITKDSDESNIQDKIKSIYNDNNDNSNTSEVIKEFINNVSKDCGTDSENLLNNESYSSKILSENNELNKTSKLTDLLSSCSGSQIIESLKQLTNNKI